MSMVIHIYFHLIMMMIMLMIIMMMIMLMIMKTLSVVARWIKVFSHDVSGGLFEVRINIIELLLRYNG